MEKHKIITDLNFKTNFNSKSFDGEVNNEPSKTVEGEALTIRELFERAAVQGHIPIDEGEGIFMDVEDIEQINKMYGAGLDIVDLQEHKKHIEDMQYEIDKKILVEKSKGILEQKEKVKAEKQKESPDKKDDSEQSVSEEKKKDEKK